MQQFQEHLRAANRKEVIKLFDHSNESTVRQPERQQFVPFNQERDKLGRLISLEGLQPSHHKKRNNLYEYLESRNISNPQSQLSQKMKQSNKTVEKMFKMKDFKDQRKGSSLSKLRILSTASRQHMQTPIIGQYDTAGIAEKFKFRKPKATAIALPREKAQLPKYHSVQSIKQSQRVNIKKEQSPSFDRIKEHKKVDINYDLPELHLYHEMRKLKMKHYENFEESHQRFKELARYSLVLANQIKKGLGLD